MCTPERQEYILLSDTLGLSALVNGLHDRTAIEDATHTSLLGPFYRENAPRLERGAQVANKVEPGTEVVLWGRVTDVRGRSLANAQISVWQTGADGLYDIQVNGKTPIAAACSLPMHREPICFAPCARSATRSLWTGRSGNSCRRKAGMACAPRTFISLSVHRDTRELVTALYIKGDAHIEDDVVFGSSGDLIAELNVGDPDCPIQGVATIRFDMKLSREGVADRTTGRVGADPAAILKSSAS